MAKDFWKYRTMDSSYSRYLPESDAGNFWLIFSMALCETTLVLSVIPHIPTLRIPARARSRSLRTRSCSSLFSANFQPSPKKSSSLSASASAMRSYPASSRPQSGLPSVISGHPRGLVKNTLGLSTTHFSRQCVGPPPVPAPPPTSLLTTKGAVEERPETQTRVGLSTFKNQGALE